MQREIITLTIDICPTHVGMNRPYSIIYQWNYICPTHVGMNRIFEHHSGLMLNLPHARRDEPMVLSSQRELR